MNDGLCECGCGEPAPIAEITHRRYGWVAGMPKRFIRGHNFRVGLLPTIERFMQHVEPGPDGCLLWTGTPNEEGYGLFSLGRNHAMMAHKWFYEYIHGPLPPGYDVHHKCPRRLCINDEHMEPLTRREHRYRHRKTHCQNGHLYVERSGRQVCQICRSEKQRERKRSEREKR